MTPDVTVLLLQSHFSVTGGNRPASRSKTVSAAGNTLLFFAVQEIDRFNVAVESLAGDGFRAVIRNV